MLLVLGGLPVLAQEASVAFEKTETLHGITFKITSPNTTPANSVTITPTGLEKDNSPITVETNGLVTGAEAGDINSDGSPEIYIYTARPDGDKRGSLIACSANKRKSLSQISLPALEDDAKNAKGYRGRDEFAVVETIVARRFPLFSEDPVDPKPTGKMRQLQYKLVAGEAGWHLKLDRVVEF